MLNRPKVVPISGQMYRVFLIPADEFAQKEVWLDAHTVLETDCGEFWDFLDGEGLVVRRLAKSSVRSFEVTPDRRKPRAAPESVPEELLARVSTPVRLFI